jgi:hypothetical protein
MLTTIIRRNKKECCLKIKRKVNWFDSKKSINDGFLKNKIQAKLCKSWKT